MVPVSFLPHPVQHTSLLSSTLILIKLNGITTTVLLVLR